MIHPPNVLLSHLLVSHLLLLHAGALECRLLLRPTRNGLQNLRGQEAQGSNMTHTKLKT